MHPLLVSAGALWFASATTVITGLHLARRRGRAAESEPWASSETVRPDPVGTVADVATDFRQWESQIGRTDA